jgi:SAM-dependent methyltransferase
VIQLACPLCHGPLVTDADGCACESCAERYPVVDGIHRFLPAPRAAHFASFLRDYTTVRLAEGRGSTDPEYFRRLPDPTPGGPIEWQWRIRRRTWATVQDRVVAGLPPRSRIVDIGAGVGWLSNRLTQLGHDVHAVDLSVDELDGLAAARHFETEFPRSQAEMDALPFADASVDLVVYNASLHYSTDYTRTLGEALRVLAPGGRVVVVESPIYDTHAAGVAMVAERHASFAAKFGTRSDSLASIEFLTPSMLADLATTLGLRWRRYRTWYGWSWALRPWRARLRRRRQPSRFVVLVARRR